MPATDTLTTLKILLVDDQPLMLKLLEGILRENHINNHQQALNGKQALTLLEKQNFDVVITDLSMEPVNGITLHYPAIA